MIIPDLICILTAITTFAIILNDDVNADYRKWKNEIPIRHGTEGRIRTLWLAIPFTLFCIPIGFGHFYIPIFLMFFTYLTLFDGLYNSKRHINFWSLGSVDDDDAITDKVLRRISRNSQIAVKITGSIISLALYTLKLFHLI